MEIFRIKIPLSENQNLLEQANRELKNSSLDYFKSGILKDIFLKDSYLEFVFYVLIKVPRSLISEQTFDKMKFP